tara:strand:+ start:213 stop:491 length:279 start_codon:yes stop_codon:yes gene_type:complete
MDRLSKTSLKNKIELSKKFKYGLIFFIGIILVPGLLLNIPPVTVETQEFSKEGVVKTITEEKWFMSGRSSLASGIVHLLLFMFLIFMIDYFF